MKKSAYTEEQIAFALKQAELCALQNYNLGCILCQYTIIHIAS